MGHNIGIYRKAMDGPEVPPTFIIGAVSASSMMVGGILFPVVGFIFLFLFIVNIILHATHEARGLTYQAHKILNNIDRLPQDIRKQLNINARELKSMGNEELIKVSDKIDKLIGLQYRLATEENRYTGAGYVISARLDEISQEKAEKLKIAKEVNRDMERML